MNWSDIWWEVLIGAGEIWLSCEMNEDLNNDLSSSTNLWWALTFDSEISRIYELKRQMMRLLRTPVDWISPLTYCTWRNCTSSNAAWSGRPGQKPGSGHFQKGSKHLTLAPWRNTQGQLTVFPRAEDHRDEDPLDRAGQDWGSWGGEVLEGVLSVLVCGIWWESHQMLLKGWRTGEVTDDGEVRWGLY